MIGSRTLLVAAVALLLTACSAPADVTDMAGTSAPPSSAPSGPAPLVDPATVADLPRCSVPVAGGAVPDGLPDVVLECLGPGGPVSLGGLRGPLVLNTWASWCPPCRSELGALGEFAEQVGSEVTVLGLNVSDSPAQAAALWRENALPYPSLLDPNGVTRPGLRWVGLPVTYFIDESGHVVGRHDGAITDVQGWLRVYQQYLGDA